MIDDLYPVPNRPALLNLRIAAHEIGHCVSARVIGSYVHSVSIVPGNGYEGRCVRSGPPSALNLASPVPEDETVEILSVCERLEQIMPEAGDSRVECSEFYIRAQCSMIELVAGRVCEKLLHPDLPTLGAVHDDVEARALARVACAQSDAVGAMLQYAEAEARAILIVNLKIVHALVGAILVAGSLSGDEVDEVIFREISAQGVAVERANRDDWRRRQASAARFLVDQQGRA